MKMNWKKVSALILAGVMVVAAFSGCSKGSSSDTAGEIPTIRYMLPSDPGYTFNNDTWTIKTWGERAGVKFEINSPPRDTFKEKLAATLASDNLPDMINYYEDKGVDTYKVYGSRLFVPINKYIDDGKLPHLKEWLDKYPDIKDEITSQDDGNIYGFPLVLDFDAFYSLWTVRNDLLNKVGWDADDIKTLDDLKKALLALKEASGQPYITSSRLGWNYFATQTGYFFGTYPGIMFDNKTSGGTNQFIYGPSTEQYKIWVEFFKWMYDNQLLHPSFATMQQQELFAGYGDGKFVLSMEQATTGPLLGGNDSKYPERDEKFIFPVEINGDIPKQAALYHQNNGFRWPVTITKSSKVVEDCIRAMDWAYSQEGYELLAYGEEGVHWEHDDNYITGRRSINMQSNSVAKKVLDGEMTQSEYDALPKASELGLGTWWITPVITETTRFGYNDRTLEEEAVTKFTSSNVAKWMATGNVVDPDPIVEFSKEDKDRITDIVTPLDTYVSEQSIKFIIGQKPMSEWDQFQAELKKMNCDELVKMYNDALNK